MPPFKNFMGGFYRTSAQQADAERSQNWFPERMETEGGSSKTSYTMLSKPGQATFAVLPATAGRAELAINGRGFVISQAGASNGFYELLANGSYVSYGTLPGDTRPQMTAIQSQILILAGGLGFIFTLATSVLAPITDANFPIGAVKAGSLDGLFIVLEPNSQTFAICNLNDGFTWNALDFGDVEGEPGNIVTFVVDHRQIWFLGNNHGEIYYDSGDANFPLTRLEGAFMEQGACAIDGAFKCDNTLFWLGGNEDGQGIFWRANGYTPQRISEHPIEALVATFGDLSTVSGYAYQEGGHTFARWDFPNAYEGRGATLLFDISSGFWHERTFWNATLGLDYADLARSHMFVFGKHLVTDYASGAIYEQSRKYTTDAGAQIRRLRASPDIANGGKWTRYSEFTLQTDVGVGLDGGGAAGPLNRLGRQFFPSLSDAVYDNVDFGAPSALYIQGDWSFGAWLQIPANGYGALVGFGAAGSSDPFSHFPYLVFLTKVGAGWSINYSHDGGTSAGIVNPPPLTFGTNLPAGQWIYVGLSRVVATSTVTLYLSLDGVILSTFGAQVYTLPVCTALPMGGAAHLQIGALPKANTNPTLPQFYPNSMILAQVYMWSAALSAADHLAAMLGAPTPSSSLAFASNLAVTPVTTSQPSTGLLTGSVTGTAIVGGGGVPAGGAPAAGTGVDPQMVLQVSNDGGKTWSKERSASLGRLGAYRKRLRYFRLGRSDNRAFRVICTEPVDVSLVACNLETSSG